MTASKLNLKSLDLPALETFVSGLGWEKYRARQIFTWLWQRGVSDWDMMTNISKEYRARLAEQAFISGLCLLRVVPDHTDKTDDCLVTAKFLFELEDGERIESVLIPEPPRLTVCVSSQVGCPLGCKICATGQQGFVRNLQFYEIADQVVQVACNIGRVRNRDARAGSERAVTNVVLMGMGEPLLNLDEVLKACEIINSDIGLRIGARHITISTAGIPEGIRRLAEYGKQFKLAVSLNATTDEQRTRLMPINAKYPMAVLFDAIRYYTGKTRRRVTLEYVLIQGVNDSGADAQRLIRMLKHLPCKINLIPFNPFPAGVVAGWQRPSDRSLEEFAARLYPELPAVSIRKSRGLRIRAACGQLAGSSGPDS